MILETTNVLTVESVIKGFAMKKKIFDQLAPTSERILDQCDAGFNLLGYVEFQEKPGAFAPAKYYILKTADGLIVKILNTKTLERRFKGGFIPQIFLV